MHVVKPTDVPPRESRIYRIDILACSVAAGAGMALVDYLEALTDTNFAASVDATGVDVETGEFDYELETEDGLHVATDYFDVSKIRNWEHLAGLSSATKTIEKGQKGHLVREKRSMSILDTLVERLENGTVEEIDHLCQSGNRVHVVQTPSSLFGASRFPTDLAEGSAYGKASWEWASSSSAAVACGVSTGVNVGVAAGASAGSAIASVAGGLTSGASGACGTLLSVDTGIGGALPNASELLTYGGGGGDGGGRRGSHDSSEGAMLHDCYTAVTRLLHSCYTTTTCVTWYTTTYCVTWIVAPLLGRRVM